MSGQDVVRFVPGYPDHEALQRAIEASARKQTINRATRFGLMVESRRGIEPGACVLCGDYPEGSLVSDSEIAGRGNES